MQQELNEPTRQYKRLNSYDDENNNNIGDEKPSSYQIPKNLEPGYIDLVQESSDVNQNFRNSSTKLSPKSLYDTNSSYRYSRSTDQKLIDAIDEHGENWEYISEKFYNCEIAPEELKNIWHERKSYLKAKKLNVQQNKVYPFWTTKEMLKLSDAVKTCGEDWKKISIEWFNGQRSSFSLENKWQKIDKKKYDQKLKQTDYRYGKNWEPVSHDKSSNLLPKWENLNEKYQNKSGVEKTSDRGQQKKIMDKGQFAREFGRELKFQWSNIVNLFGQPVTSIEIYFSQLDSSWTKEENSTLFAAIKEFGTKDWEKTLELLPGKSLKNIQERCSNVLWEPQEVEAFDKAFEQYGSKWDKISGLIGTRSPGQCWSYWRTTTGYDISESNVKSGMLSSNDYMKLKNVLIRLFFIVTGGNQHANVFIQFPDKEISQMSFVRYDTKDDFISEKMSD
ncbi:hypothetical protein C1645_742610 [Glomus cerebriforme]|uniref:Homeodomain-like protein n=1 Tax=Glomus cerebriforme TaxID=658196 RepID=A0A397SET6_9GLOM|nr:hypothetical protein C1645_742610 [Glomus cerebriforme]